MINRDYEDFTSKEKEDFARIINLLLSKTFIVRELLISLEEGIKINEDYRFAIRHFDVIRQYLNMTEWEISEEAQYGVIRLYNRQGSNRAKLNEFTTKILYILRLIYEEERETLSLNKFVVTSIENIISKMMTLKLITKKPANKELLNSFSMLKNFNLIDRVSGSWDSPDTKILIYPSILFIVSNERISKMHELLKTFGKDDLEHESDFAEITLNIV